MSRVRMAGRRARLLTAATALTLLSPLASCSSASTAVEACMGKQAVSATTGELEGTYTGEAHAKGVKITLKASDTGTGGTVTVRNWPTGAWYKSELGETFDGSGTWGVEGGHQPGDHALVHLSFTEPELFLRDYTIDMLSIAKDSQRIYLYEDYDPDVCPTFRLRRA